MNRIQNLGDIPAPEVVERIEVSIPDWAHNYLVAGHNSPLSQAMKDQVDFWLSDIKHEYSYLDCSMAIEWEGSTPILHLEPSFGASIHAYKATIIFYEGADL